MGTNENQAEIIDQVQVEKQERELPQPPAEVDRRQCDEHLRDSLHFHDLHYRWRMGLVPRLALEQQLRKRKSRPRHFANRSIFYACCAGVRGSASLFQPSSQVQ